MFIDKLLFSEPIVFKVSDAGQNNSETALSWKTNYIITRVKSGVSQNIKVSQLVYLFEQDKSFGTSSKNVTVSFLGKMLSGANCSGKLTAWWGMMLRFKYRKPSRM